MNYNFPGICSTISWGYILTHSRDKQLLLTISLITVNERVDTSDFMENKTFEIERKGEEVETVSTHILRYKSINKNQKSDC